MFIPFEELRDESRVWIYQGNRTLLPAEEKIVSDLLQSFCEKWAAHGQPLQTSFKIVMHQFIIMALDEDFKNPSGCSIDSSVGVLRQIQSVTGIDFLDRSWVPFYVNDKIEAVSITELKSGFSSGRLKPDTLTLNTLAATKGDLAVTWTIPAEKSWMAKYLPKTSLTL